MKDRPPGDCPRLHGDEGPCPFVGCVHHLWCDVMPDGGLRVTHPTIDPWDLPATCAIDVAMAGGIALADIAAIEGITRERVRQILLDAIGKLVESNDAFAEAFEESEEGIRKGGFLTTARLDGNADRGERDPVFIYADRERTFSGRGARRRCEEHAARHGLSVIEASALTGEQRQLLRVGVTPEGRLVDESGRRCRWASIDPTATHRALEWVTREQQGDTLQGQLPGLEDGRRPRRRRSATEQPSEKGEADDQPISVQPRLF